MFTGIVTDIGRIRAVRDTNRDRRFEVETGYDLAGVDIGASISHAGCCLTVVEKGEGWFAVEVSGATLSMTAGVRDNRPVEQRADVLVFTSEPLREPVEVVGDVTAELHVTRDNPNADLFVRLCDVDEPGDAHSRSRNVCDGIVRLTGADPLTGTVRVSLIGAAHRFGCGHRLRVQVAGGAFPRFARNPGNGQVDASAKDFVVTHYSVQSPSALVISQVKGKETAHA